MRVKVITGTPSEIAEYEQLKAQNRKVAKKGTGKELLEIFEMEKPEHGQEQQHDDIEVVKPEAREWTGSRKKAARSCMPWTKQEWATLSVLGSQNMRPDKIAKILQRSVTAVKWALKAGGNRLTIPIPKKEHKRGYHRIVHPHERARFAYVAGRGNAYMKLGMSRKDAWKKAADEWKIMHPKN